MKCVICKQEIKSLKENRWFPFCSEKCKMTDLYNWLSEEYSVFDDVQKQEQDEKETW